MRSARFAYIFWLICGLVFSGCGSLHFEETSQPIPKISGLVYAPAGSFAVSKVSSIVTSPIQFVNQLFGSPRIASACDISAVTLQLYSISATTGLREGAPIVTGQLSGIDGSYSLDPGDDILKSLSGGAPVSYVIDVLGCNGDLVYSRPVTGAGGQDISAMTSLVGSVLELDQASRLRLKAMTSAQVSAFFAQVTTVLGIYTSVSDLYQSLSANATLAQQFQDLFGFGLASLTDAAPKIISKTLPVTLNELQTGTYYVAADHWNPTYTIAYLWKLDGTSINTTSDYSYVPSANSQGSHVITLYVGKDNGSGGIDITKPYYTKSVTVVVANSTPATPPALTVQGATAMALTSTSVNLALNTGASNANCASFTKLVLVEGTSVAPTDPSLYTITCTTAGTQTIPYTLLSATLGAKRLYLWAMDSSGNISVAPTILDAWLVGPPINALSTVTATPTTHVTADGGTYSFVTVTMRDTLSTPLPSRTITLSSSRGASDTVTAVNATTNSSGQAIFKVSSLTAGSATFTAIDTGASMTLTNTASAAFVGVGLSGAKSSLNRDVGSVVADGTSVVTLTATIKDLNSALMPGRSISITSSRGASDIISPAVATTDGNGQAVFTVHSTLTGSATFTATDGADGIVINQTQTVTFTAGQISTTLSTMQISQSSIEPGGTSNVDLTLYDDYHNLITDPTAISNISASLIATGTSRGSFSPFTVIAGPPTVFRTVFTGTTGGTASLIRGYVSGRGVLTATQNITVAQRVLALTGPSTLTNGICSSVYTLSHQDSSGLGVNTSADKSISFTGTGSLVFYSDSACTAQITLPMTMANGTNTKTFYAKDVVKENLSISAVSTGVVTATKTISIIGASPTRLSLNGVSPLAADTCSLAYSINSLDAYGNLASVSTDTVVNLAAGSYATFYSDAACTSSVTSATILSGQSLANFYFNSTQPNTYLLTAASGSLTTATFNLTVSSAAPVKVVLTGPTSATAGTCTTYTAKAVDAHGADSNVSAITTINLTGKGTGAFYKLAGCSSGSNSVDIAANTSAVTFYFKDTATETLGFAGAATGLITGSLGVNVVASGATKLALSGAATLINGSCGAYMVQAKDTNSNVANVSTGTTVNLGGNGAGAFYSDAGCTASITSTTIASGANTSTVYFKAASAASFNFTAADASSALTAATALAVATRVTKLAITGSQNILPGACGTYNVVNQDINNNPVNTGSAQTIALTGIGTGAFYSDSACTTTTPSVIIASGTSSKTVYFSAAAAQYLTFQATNATMAVGTLNVSIGTIKLSIAGPASPSAGLCTAAYTVTTQDGASLPVNVLSSTPVALIGQGSGSFYSDSSCTSAVSTINVSTGTSSTTFYFKDSSKEALTFQAAATAMTSAVYGVSVSGGAPAHIGVRGPNSLSRNVCSPALQLVPYDSFVNETSITSSVTATFSQTGSLSFYSDSGCTTPIASLTLTAGTPEPTFYVKDAAYETVAVSTSSTLTSDPFQLIVTAPVVHISAGALSTCAISAGRVFCWGDNTYGELGNNSNVTAPAPVQVIGITNATAVASSYTHTCAIDNGAVKCWGDNATGQLGNGSYSKSLVPVQVSGLTSGATAITVGLYYSCAVVNGAAKCWGVNTYGNLGNGSTTNKTVPTAVVGLSSGVTQIAANYYATCAQVNDGVKCWGYNAANGIGNGGTQNVITPYDTLPAGSGVVGLASSGGATGSAVTHFCAIIRVSGNDGLKCWGSNQGRTGDGTTTTSTATPTQVTGLTTGVTSAAAGSGATCAIVNGAAQCWGGSSTGQLGNGSLALISSPTAVSGLNANVTEISGGLNHTCAIVSGQAMCWGDNTGGRLGTGLVAQSSQAVQVTGLTSGVTDVKVSLKTVCALIGDSVKCWGYNGVSQLGNGGLTDSSSPVQVTGLGAGAQVTALATSASASCAIVNGAVLCWGSPSGGQMGGGGLTNGSVPIPVYGLTSGVTKIAASYNSFCALQNGNVMCWGTNINSQLGDGTTSTRYIPVLATQVPAGVTDLAGGIGYMCALYTNSVKCWGLNSYGNLGDGTTTDHSVPVVPVGLTSQVSQISAGLYHACAVVNGGVQCWGSNATGQLGDGSTTQRSSPVQVTGLTSGVTSLSNGADFTCAVVNGGVKCWGSNASGQLGTSSTSQSLVPVSVDGLTSGVVKVSASSWGKEACAVLSSGAVKCWGSNSNGQLGNSTVSTGLALVPQFVLPFDTTYTPPPAGVDLSAGQYLTLKGPSTNNANTCSAIITAGIFAADGSSQSANVDTPVSVSGRGSGQLYLDSNCSSVATGLSILAGTSSVSFYYKNSIVEDVTLAVDVDTYRQGSLSISNSAAIAYTLAFANVPATISTGACSSAITVKTVDSNGAPLAVTSAASVGISGVFSGRFYLDSACSANQHVEAFTIASGTSSRTVYYRDDIPETAAITMSGVGLTSGSLTIVSTATAAVRWAIRGPSSTPINTCSAPISVLSLDTNGNAAPIASTTTINLAASGQLKLYSDSTCSTLITSLSMPSGTATSPSFYLRNVVPTTDLLAATGGALTGDIFQVATTSGAPTALTMTGPPSATVGSCAGFTFTSRDIYGYPSAVSVAATITLAGKGSGTWYNSTCSSTQTGGSINANAYTGSIYLKDLVTETLTLTGAATGLTSAAMVHTLLPAAATKLAVSGAATLTVGACGTYVVQAKDTNSNLANVSSLTTINLTGNGTGSFYSDNGCTAAVTSTQITNGAQTSTFYFKAASAASFSFVATDAAAALTTSSALAVATKTNQLVLSGPATLTPNTCSTAYTVTNKNLAGTAVNVGSATTVTLAGKGSGSFYSDSGCTTTAPSVVIASGTSSQVLYFKDATPEALAFTATNASITTGTYNVSVGAFRLVLSGPGVVNANSCSTAYTLASQDGNSSTTVVAADTVASLFGSGSGAFYSDSACTTPITSVTVTSGTSSANFYFKDLTVEGLLFQASATGFAAAAYAMSSAATSATALAVAGPVEIPVATCSTVYTISANDANAHSRTFQSSTTVTLAGAGTGAFYSDSGCTTPITSLGITSSSSTGSVYLMHATVGTKLTLTFTDSSGLATATKIVAVVATPPQISAGSGNSCAVKSGDVYCWGGITLVPGTAASTPTKVQGLPSGVSQVSAGVNAACAVVSGQVFCWGSNFYGEMGLDPTVSPVVYRPTAVAGISTATAVTMGENHHACALLADQTAMCWGLNDNGQLGNATLSNTWVPQPVSFLTGITQISAGYANTCAISGGGVYCWGGAAPATASSVNGDGTTVSRFIPTQVFGLPPGSGATRVAVARGAACAIVNGGVQCWGTNSKGEAGQGTTTVVLTPAQIASLPAASGATDISAATASFCAIVSGALQCWGDNSSGVLGFGDLSTRKSPATMVTSGATQISMLWDHACAVINGVVQCWGNNSQGEIGLGELRVASSPNWVVGLGAGSGATALASNKFGSCALVGDGVKCWGVNSNGQVGVGSGAGGFSTPMTPTGLGSGSGVTSISGGSYGHCATLSDGSVHCWGANINGETGSSSVVNQITAPVTSIGLGAGSGATSVSGASSSQCAVVNGGVFCWGANANNELGLGDIKIYAPAAIPNYPASSGVIQVAKTNYATCALYSTGDVKCFGLNTAGTLGDGTQLNRPTPVSIALRRPATKIVAGGWNVCAVLDDGGVQCWGGTTSSVTGIGGLGVVSQPVDIVMTGASDVSVLWSTFCAVVSGGVKCWGDNAASQTGTVNSSLQVLTPTAVQNLPSGSGVTAVSTGMIHSCAVVSGGVQCWGDNSYGQLGLGASPDLNVLTPRATAPF